MKKDDPIINQAKLVNALWDKLENYFNEIELSLKEIRSAMVRFQDETRKLDKMVKTQ